MSEDIRLISIDALLRLLTLKEEVEDPSIARKIAEILIPYEYTRVDRIIDLVFSTAEDVLQEETATGATEEVKTEGEERKPKFIPVRFHDACVARIEQILNRPLLKRSRATFETADHSLALSCAVSREPERGGVPGYGCAFHPHQRHFLAAAPEACVAFGCGSPDAVLLTPFAEFRGGWRGWGPPRGRSASTDTW